MPWKKELEERQERLSSIRREVPARARRFHGNVSDLAEEMRRRSAWWKPWLGQDRLASYDRRLERLREVADDLRPFLSEVDEALRSLEDLDRKAQTAGPSLEKSLQRSLRGWKRILRALGSRVDRPDALSSDRTRLAEVEKERIGMASLLDLFVRGREIVEDLEGTPLGADLAAALDHFESRLRGGEPIEEWREELRKKVDEADLELERQRRISQERGDLRQSLQDIRKWSVELGQGEKEWRNLDRDFDDLSRESDASAKEERLRKDADRLLRKLIDEAEARREKLLKELETQIEFLARHTGGQNHLRSGVEELGRDLGTRMPESHGTWLGRAASLDKRLRSEITNRGGELSRKLRRGASEIAETVDDLLDGPLRSELREKLEERKDEIVRLARGEPGLDLFDALERVTELRREIDGIRDAIAEDRRKLEYRRRDLRRRLMDLEQLATQEGRAIDTTALQDGLEEGEEEKGFDRAVAHFRAWEERLGELERTFVGSLAEGAAELLARISAHREILSAGRSQGSEDDLEGVAADLPPREAVRRHSGLVTQEASWAERVEEELMRLDGKREETIEKLEHLDLSRLSAHDRKQATEHSQTLRGFGLLGGTPDPDEVANLRGKLRRVRDYFDRIEAEARSIVERRASLLAELQKCKDEGLTLYCPQHFERIEALLMGCRERTRRPDDALRQLKEAEEMLWTTRNHAARLAVREMLDAVEQLREVMRNTGHGESREDARELLRKFGRLPAEELPPVALRRQLLHAADLRSGSRS